MAFIVQACVNMTEVWYVGQLGTISLAAMALMFPLLMLLQMLANGAMGGAVTGSIARSLGGGQKARAEALIWHAMMIALLAGFGFMGLAALFLEPLLLLMSNNSEVLTESSRYGLILFTGAPLLWCMAVLSSSYRGMGNMRFPAILMVGGALLQIPLSGALILGWFGAPRMGIAGAALSTLIIAGVSTILLLLGLCRRDSPLQLRWSGKTPRAELFKAILKVGLPSSLSPFFTIATISGLNILVGRFGVAALAGYGVASRIEFLVVPLVFGLGVAMNALVGVNLGAGQVKRAVSIGWVGGATAAVLAGTGGVVLALFPDTWASLFTNDPATLESARGYLRYAGPFFAFQGLGLSLYFASQGAGTMKWPLIATFARFAVAIGGGSALLFGLGVELNTIYLASGLAMLVYGLITAGALKMGMWEG